MQAKPNFTMSVSGAHVEDCMQNPMRWRLIGIGLSVLAIGAVAGLLIGRRRNARPQLPDATIWRQALTEKYGPIEASALIEKAQQRYEVLYRARPHHNHPALRMHLTQNILPALALYQVLLANKRDQAAALAEMESLLHASAVRSNLRKMTAALKDVPEPYRLLRPVVRVAMQFGFPAAGWETEWIEDSDQRMAFNIHRCFYLNTLTAYDAPELTRLFCQMDDVVYEALPLSIQWERTGTLGRGDGACDFCYRHIA